MRILHTSDLHLGRSLLEESLYLDQRHMLLNIIKIIDDYEIDAIIIAGDVYDKNVPSVEAVNMLNDFLNKLVERGIKTFIISGNHDSNDRLKYGRELFSKVNIHIEVEYKGSISKYTYGDVCIYLLPFMKPFHLKNFISDKEYEDIKTSQDMISWILAHEEIDDSKKNILVAHQFVISGNNSIDNTHLRDFNVGTIDAIDSHVFDDFDYVALGHIHKGYFVEGNKIRYSGSPLKYSFNDIGNFNSVVILDTDNMETSVVEIEPLRKLRVIRGYFNDIMKLNDSDDLIRIELNDLDNLISPMEVLKGKFPNALSLGFVSKQDGSNVSDYEMVKMDSLLDLFNNFYEVQNGCKMSDEEYKYFEKIVDLAKEDDKCES